MTRFRKASSIAATIAAVALVLPLSATAAFAQTQHIHEDEVEFASVHNCTGEPVQGDVWVKMTITQTANPDNTTTIKVKQHTHGQQLLGLISNDWYVFNDAQDQEETFTLLGPSGTVSSRTTYIHTTEDLAYQEVQGLDDFHQRMEVTFSPLLPPVITKSTSECK